MQSCNDEQGENNMRLKALPTSSGRAWGKVVFYDEMVCSKDEYLLSAVALAELECLLIRAYAQLHQSLNKAIETQCQVTIDIKNAHIAILNDPNFLEPLRRDTQKFRSIAQALQLLFVRMQSQFAEISVPHIRDRFCDVHDVINRLLSLYHSKRRNMQEGWPERLIVFTKSALPSAAIDVPLERLCGVVSGAGSHDCHLSIIARSKGIPCINQIDISGMPLLQGQEVMIDGNSGWLLVNPSLQEKKQCEVRIAQNASLPVCTLSNVLMDGTHIEILANIEHPAQVPFSLQCGASGIGLVRTEHLALEIGDFPTFLQQLEYFKKLFIAVKGKKTVRLFDLGSDKSMFSCLSYQEPNPALGLRGIRLLLHKKSLLIVHLEALMSAWKECEQQENNATLHILVPMVTHVSEIIELREILRIILKDKKIKKTPKLGVMLEVPSAVISIASLAQVSEFFSIGSNDLLQYTCAVDRNHVEMQPLYNPQDPAFLTLIQYCIHECQRLEKPLSLCGELAANPQVLPLLIGMGLRTFSMSPSLIKGFKEQIQQYRLCELQERVQVFFGSPLLK